MNDILNKIKSEQVNFLNQFNPSLPLTFEINCNNLKQEYINDLDVTFELNDLFDKLNEIVNPCVYIIDISSDHNYDDISEAIRKFQKNKNKLKLTLPPINNNKYAKFSKTLYVGKRLGGKNKRISFVSGRMIHHLGFYTRIMNNKRELVTATSSLQLFHWSEGMNLSLKLSIIEFPKELSLMLGVFENEISKIKHPILGQHRS